MPFKGQVVVIGASAGGITALKELILGLPRKCEAALFVVLHVPPYQSSNLPTVLNSLRMLPASHPRNGAKIQAGHIYVAPPDHHLLIDDGKICVSKGPKENRFRPSVDALFRSAAYRFGPNAIGVILSGALDDGTSGLWTIKRLGGTSIVQEPKEAQFESMPRSAAAQVEIDHTVQAKDMGPLITRLISEKSKPITENKATARLRDRVKMELDIAKENNALEKGVMEAAELTPFTCPECHGVLVKIKEGKWTRYRCHTGHAYSDSALVEGVMESSGEMLWQVMRSLEEAVMVIQKMADDQQAENPKVAGIYRSKAKELYNRSKQFHEMVLAHESLSGDNIARKSD